MKVKDNCRSFVATLLWMTGAVLVLQILRRCAPLDDGRGFGAPEGFQEFIRSRARE